MPENNDRQPLPGTPPDLADLLTELSRVPSSGGDPLVLLQLAQKIRAMASSGLRPDNAIRRLADSEDLMQETLLDLVEVVDQFRGKTWPEFLGFVRALLERRQINHARRLRVRKAELQTNETFDSSNPHASSGLRPDQWATKTEEQARLAQMIDALPAKYREPLRLRLDGKSMREIANELSQSADNTRKQISRALQMLRKGWQDVR